MEVAAGPRSQFVERVTQIGVRIQLLLDIIKLFPILIESVHVMV